MSEPRRRVAIIDYGMGNLFSVQRACEVVGLDTVITSSPNGLNEADGIILPGVGAFGDAMQSLKNLNLIESLRSLSHSGKPFMGVCLGMQLLMESSFEFGQHEGLGILKGRVVRFESPQQKDQPLKVPHIGWNRLFHPRTNGAPSHSKDVWSTSPLDGLADGTFMYFVHSYYVEPATPDVILSISTYGQTEFCSSLRSDNIFACQYHPERSGPEGLKIYSNFNAHIGRQSKEVNKHVH